MRLCYRCSNVAVSQMFGVDLCDRDRMDGEAMIAAFLANQSLTVNAVEVTKLDVPATADQSAVSVQAKVDPVPDPTPIVIEPPV